MNLLVVYIIYEKLKFFKGEALTQYCIHSSPIWDVFDKGVLRSLVAYASKVITREVWVEILSAKVG
jgi:hypothetical protein